MKRDKLSSRDRIPDEVLKEIFSERLRRFDALRTVYNHLRLMIVSGKLKKGEKIVREHIAQDFNVNKMTVDRAFAKLKKEGLVVVRGSAGSFVKGKTKRRSRRSKSPKTRHEAG